MRVSTATRNRSTPYMLTATVKPTHNQPTAHPAHPTTGNQPSPA